MTTTPTLTPARLAEMRALFVKCTPGNLATAEVHTTDEWLECPACQGEGCVDGETYVNIDGAPLTVQFYGIGEEFGHWNEFWSAAVAAMPALLDIAERSLARETPAESETPAKGEASGYDYAQDQEAIRRAVADGFIDHQHPWCVAKDGHCDSAHKTHMAAVYRAKQRGWLGKCTIHNPFAATEEMTGLAAEVASERETALREAVEALINMTGDQPPNDYERGGCIYCGGPYGKGPGTVAGPALSDHGEDCKWIRARVALARIEAMGGGGE